MTQWDFLNKGTPRWTGTRSFVLKVPLRYLRPSVIYSVPCDWILQMAYSLNCLCYLCLVMMITMVLVPRSTLVLALAPVTLNLLNCM